jgi:hypothetical protein
MARYGKETTLPPRRVLQLARAFFGPSGEVGLDLAKDALSEIGFAGGGGGVEVSARPRPSDPNITDVTILSREFDYYAERFLGILSDAELKPTLLDRIARLFKRGN